MEQMIPSSHFAWYPSVAYGIFPDLAVLVALSWAYRPSTPAKEP